jgi:hypothetical protein
MNFEKIDNDALLNSITLQYNADDLKYHLAHDYNKCINISEKVCKSKIEFIKEGNIFIIVSMLMFILEFANFAYNTISKKDTCMIKKENATSCCKIDQASKPTVIKEGNNDKPTPGIGTKPIERSGQ